MTRSRPLGRPRPVLAPVAALAACVHDSSTACPPGRRPRRRRRPATRVQDMSGTCPAGGRARQREAALPRVDVAAHRPLPRGAAPALCPAAAAPFGQRRLLRRSPPKGAPDLGQPRVASGLFVRGLPSRLRLRKVRELPAPPPRAPPRSSPAATADAGDAGPRGEDAGSGGGGGASGGRSSTLYAPVPPAVSARLAKTIRKRAGKVRSLQRCHSPQPAAPRPSRLSRALPLPPRPNQATRGRLSGLSSRGRRPL